MPNVTARSDTSARWAAPLLLVALVAAPGCQWHGWIPGEPRVKPSTAPGEFVPLYAGRPRQGELDCPAGRCQVRYRIQVREPGELQIELVHSIRGTDIGMRVVLEDPTGQVLGQERATGGETSLRLNGQVKPGPHFVLVQAIGGHVGYEVTATMAGTGGAPVPPPAPEDRLSPPTDRVGDKTASLGSDSAYDPGVDFSSYRRFAFAQRPEERLEGPPGSSAGNPFLEAEVQRAIRLELLDRGFALAPEAEADFLVSSHVGAQSKTWYSINDTPYLGSYDQWFDRWASGGAYIREHTYRNGTLVIDIIDMTTQELTWHGWTTQPIPLTVDTNALIRSAVAEVLDKFPPR